MFTFAEFRGSLDASIFWNSSSASVILDPDYLPDYLYVSYDYVLTN